MSEGVKGRPYRHTKDKANLMIEQMAGSGYAGLAKILKAMEILVEKRPGDVLDALIEASGEKD